MPELQRLRADHATAVLAFELANRRAGGGDGAADHPRMDGWPRGAASGWKLLVVTSIAAGLGLVMILLKDLVLIHLH